MEDLDIQFYISDMYIIFARSDNIDDIDINYDERIKTFEIKLSKYINSKELCITKHIYKEAIEGVPIELVCKQILDEFNDFLKQNNLDNYKNKLKAIFNKHGVSNQLKKLAEEVFELQEAIIEYENSGCCDEEDSVEFVNHIAEEIADVMVVLNQIKEAYKLDEDEIKNIMKLKIDRQCERDGIDAGNS